LIATAISENANFFVTDENSKDENKIPMICKKRGLWPIALLNLLMQ
jgi:hypothetical protein